MDYEFSKDQEMIRETVNKFLENECPKERIRELKHDKKGYDPEVWSKMVELGWMGLVLPEEYGGTGAEYMDLMVIFEEMGRNLLPAPFFSTVALCSLPILEFGSEEQKKSILPNIAEKGEIWSLAILEKQAVYEPSDIQLSATASGDDFVLSGTKLFVPYSDVADNLLVVGRTSKKDNPADGVTVFIVDAKAQGIKMEEIPTLSHENRCEIVFDNVKVPKSNVLGQVDKGWDVVEYIIQNATVLKCAEMSGGAQAVLEMSNEYAKERVQFDNPIGKYQAIQHRLVDMLTDVEGLKFIVYRAAWEINNGTPSPLIISAAKTKANKVYQRLCIDGMQIHGAMGFTEEMDVGLYHIRTKANEFELGGNDFHRERIATELESYKPDFLSH